MKVTRSSSSSNETASASGSDPSGRLKLAFVIPSSIALQTIELVACPTSSSIRSWPRNVADRRSGARLSS